MAVSKRLRYEVLRRDNHTCRYCGSSAPDVKLTVDHVVPTALGGTDAPDNLVAACRDCNAGKSATNPDAPLVDDVKQDALRWARAREMAAVHLRERVDRRNKVIDGLMEYWRDAFLADQGDYPDLPGDADQSFGYWLDHGLAWQDMTELMENVVIPRAGRIRWDNLWNYFAGCCWSRLRQIDNAAQALIDQEDLD